MSCFKLFSDKISEPKKIGSFSFNENVEILKDETANKVYFNDEIMKIPNLSIDLKRNLEHYYHMVEEYKKKFRSNILLHYKRIGSGKFRENMQYSEFFAARGTASALAGAYNDNKELTFWAVDIDGVIVIADEYKEDPPTIESTINSFIGLNFENIVASKEIEKFPNYGRYVHNWEQYKEIYNLDVTCSPKYKLKVAISCEVDAFDRKTEKPLEFKTKYMAPGRKPTFFNEYTAVSAFFQCMLGKIEEIIIGIRDKDYVVHKINRIPTSDLLKYKEVTRKIKNCCEQLGFNLKRIRDQMLSHQNIKCIKINASNNCNSLTFKNYSKYPDEMKNLFTPEFCHEFFN